MKLSPKHTPFSLLLVFGFVFSFFVYSQAQDSCTSPLSLQGPLPFDTTNLVCVNVWSEQGYILRYAQAAPSTWNFLLSAPSSNAYIAMGFSPSGRMVGSRAIVGWVQSDGTSIVRKYFLGGQTPSLVRFEPAEQGSLRVANLSLNAQSNRTYMAFQLTTNTPSTRLIYAIGPDGRLPTGPDYQLAEHDDMITTVLNFATGQFQTQNSSPWASLRRSHGLLNMFGWAIFLPIGAMVARYLRRYEPMWFYSHAIIQSIGFILGVSGVICGLVLEGRTNASVDRHKGIGIFVLILGCLQVIAFLARPDKEAKVRKYWNWYHFGVGRLLIFLAAINVFYGIRLGNAGTGWNAGFAIVLVIFFITTLILELRMYFKK